MGQADCDRRTGHFDIFRCSQLECTREMQWPGRNHGHLPCSTNGFGDSIYCIRGRVSEGHKSMCAPHGRETEISRARCAFLRPASPRVFCLKYIFSEDRPIIITKIKQLDVLTPSLYSMIVLQITVLSRYMIAVLSIIHRREARVRSVNRLPLVCLCNSTPRSLEQLQLHMLV